MFFEANSNEWSLKIVPLRNLNITKKSLTQRINFFRNYRHRNMNFIAGEINRVDFQRNDEYYDQDDFDYK